MCTCMTTWSSCFLHVHCSFVVAATKVSISDMWVSNDVTGHASGLNEKPLGLGWDQWWKTPKSFQKCVYHCISPTKPWFNMVSGVLNIRKGLAYQSIRSIAAPKKVVDLAEHAGFMGKACATIMGTWFHRIQNGPKGPKMNRSNTQGFAQGISFKL